MVDQALPYLKTLVNVAGESTEAVNAGSSVLALHEQQKEGLETFKVFSLPSIPTHKVSLEERACYRDYGLGPDELKSRVTTLTASVGTVEPTLVRHAARIPINKPISIPTEEGVSAAVSWTNFRVCEWIRELGYAKYVNCFKQNFIDGRKLIHFQEISNFPKIGITDFEDMKHISRCVRELLQVEKPKLYPYQDYTGYISVSHPPDIPYVFYLKSKARNGKSSNSKTYEQYQAEYKERYNRAFDLPSFERKWRKFKEI